MEVFPLVDERTVLRVPRRTEQQLIDEFGSSGRRALADGHQVSVTTETELKDLEMADSYIGAFLPDTTPFADLGLDNQFRYYSLQRRIWVAKDLRICTERLRTTISQHSLERFIRDVRDMVQNLGMLPDLAGKGNLVLDQFGLVKLIDINNFRRLVPDEEVEKALSGEFDLDEYVLGRKDIRKRLPPDFLDDLGNPIADLSLAALETLEIRGLGRDPDSLAQDAFYSSLRHPKRRLALALLHTDTA